MWNMKKIAVFDQYIVLARVINAATVRCCKQSNAEPWQVGDTHRRSLHIALESCESYRITAACLLSRDAM